MLGQTHVPAPYKKLLVATDFSPHAEAALRTAVWLAQQSAAELTLAHVIADAATIAYKAVPLSLDSERVERELQRNSDERLAAIEREAGMTGVRFSRMTLAGLPFVALTHAVQEGGYDLVVCGVSHYLLRLQAFSEEVLGTSLGLSLHVEFGEPWEYIRDTARFVKADLVVMGTVGRSGVQGIWLGNTAEKLLGVMDCAVLTVKPPGFVSPIPPLPVHK